MLQQKKVNFFYCILCIAPVFLMTAGMAHADGSANNPWSDRDKAWDEGATQRPWGNTPKGQRQEHKKSVKRHQDSFAMPGYGTGTYNPGYQVNPYPYYSGQYYGYQQPYNPYGNWNPYSMPGAGYGFPGFGGSGFPGMGNPGFGVPFSGW